MTTIRNITKYGWKPQLPDGRDVKFVYKPTIRSFPSSVDLRPNCPPVYDQGQLGSCTGNGTAAAIEFAQIKEKNTVFTPSRLFIYYNERLVEGTVSQDAGAEIRDGLKVVAAQGACSETDWPYDISQFATQPPENCYSDAKKDLVSSYHPVNQTLNDMKSCLAEGYPIVIGFTVYDSFESQEVASTGVVPMPKDNENVLGGHCVVIVGYDDPSQRFIVRNSWGTGWGMDGYCTMPYSYLDDPNLASDFWTIRSVTG